MTVFFENNKQVEQIINDGLHGLHDGELFCENKISEHLLFDNGVLKKSSYDQAAGFGLRGVFDDRVMYIHSSDFDCKKLKEAADGVRVVRNNQQGGFFLPTSQERKSNLYNEDNPLNELPTAAKIKILQDIDKYLRDKDQRVVQVTASLFGE